LPESSTNTPLTTPITIAVDEPILPAADENPASAQPVERELIGALSGDGSQNAGTFTESDDLLADLLAEAVGSPLPLR
jgi:hypothetical protein